MSVERHQFASGADSSGRIYAIGGLGPSGQVLASAERYVASTDAWEAVAPLPVALRWTPKTGPLAKL